MITKIFGEEYNNYINGEESIYTPTIEYAPVTSSDIERQSSGEAYDIHFSGFDPEADHGCSLWVDCGGLLCVDTSVSGRSAVYFDKSLSQNGGTYLATIYYDNGNSYIFGSSYIKHVCGAVTNNRRALYVQSCNSNIPVFLSEDAAIEYIKTGNGYENAINYEKNYRIGDWLQDDWSGELLDPYTGLHALGDMYNIARHQGLNALGNEIDFSQFTDFIRDYFGNLDTANLPEVDPNLSPINYPVSDNFPEYSFDPENNPVLQPIIDPGTAPGTGNDPDNPDKDTPDDPSGGGSSGGDSSESGPFIADLSKFFPFCIPFDLIHLLSVLEADPETPRWEIPFKIPAYGVDETIVIDLSAFDGVAKIVRLCETILFIFSLILATRELIKG